MNAVFKSIRDSSKSSLHPSSEARIDVIPDSDQLNEPIRLSLRNKPSKHLNKTNQQSCGNW